MKRLLVFIFLVPTLATGQYTFVSPPASPGCNMRNANDGLVPSFREDIKRAVFTYTVSGIGSCTGTLINRNANEQDLGTYFVTSWHCFKDGSTCGGNEFNWSIPIVFKFNYQSPPDQLGKVFYFNQNFNQYGNAYSITRNVRLVDKVSCGYGDFAICEILGPPIPPHFNPYFAGWQPAGFSPIDSYIDFSHPNSSLKQVAMTNYVQNGYTGSVAAETCKTITKLIDFITGLFRRKKKRWSSQVLCQYVQIPFVDTRLIAKGWNHGNLEIGSSGSALLNGNNRILGTFSGSLSSCNVGDFWFGKFQDYYYRGDIKNTLNPTYTSAVDEIGIPGRNRNCYDNIDYNYGVSYNLFPANLYQSQNALTFNSKNNVFLGKDLSNQIFIKTGADFTFNAGNTIELGTGFRVESGAIFKANAANGVILRPGFQLDAGASFTATNNASACGFSGSYRIEEEEEESPYEAMAREELFARMQAVQIPDELDLTASMPTREMAVNLFPNPAKESVKLFAAYTPSGNLSVHILNCMGLEVCNGDFTVSKGAEIELPVSGLSNGIYKVILRSGKSKTVQTLVIQK